MVFLRNFATPLILVRWCSQRLPQPLRSRKGKSIRNTTQNFADFRRLKAIAGTGGDGCISFLSIYANEFAGPDGGDGGNGGHVIFKATYDIKDLNHVPTLIRAECGEKGGNKDCHGKNADHHIVDVPVGTIIKNQEGNIIGDLDKEGLMFVAARGGAGGKGNHFFCNDTEQAPKICEYGATGEQLDYTLEIRSMAHIGLIGYPNAGKSTLLQAMSRARPKIAPYPFTTVKPHLGMVLYDDYEQIAVADLPGLIPDSHKNRGLGIRFLKHAERCAALVIVVDTSLPEPEEAIYVLRHEMKQFSEELANRPQIIAANKMDLPGADKNVKRLQDTAGNAQVVPISAKMGTNIVELLRKMRLIYDECNEVNRKSEEQLG
ncbi:unnamed protein product [Acanthoscelides obtectus]|uniref:Mitochondrial ribosome-associated GTPase 2 n=2 Tax=Acanthoscelides obtectus TaxID=200917 RepID=A0A9P0PV54_ACAOB|nr:unnamed protein product [Acanthoscelides obtectus]CAK1651287.1 Mitochondrial ribosome-associated GTPase 2 [Acanthoscelides obtectus]